MRSLFLLWRVVGVFWFGPDVVGFCQGVGACLFGCRFYDSVCTLVG